MEADAPPGLPDDVSLYGIQQAGDGAGALLHRTYTARVEDARLSADELMSCLREDPNRASPTELAKFRKVEGSEGRMATGDEYIVRMPGPWNGPVRVVDLTPAPFASPRWKATSRRARSSGAPATTED